MSVQDDFSSLFAAEPENGLATGLATTAEAPWKVLLVDDEPDIHAVLRLATQDIMVEGRALRP
jgi:hypothetical protein